MRSQNTTVKRARKKYYNHYALGQYLIRVSEVEEDIAAGKPIRAVLLSAFNGRLLDHLLKAVGEPKFTREEMLNQSLTYR